jgi:hypothetical protein
VPWWRQDTAGILPEKTRPREEEGGPSLPMPTLLETGVAIVYLGQNCTSTGFWIGGILGCCRLPIEMEKRRLLPATQGQTTVDHPADVFVLSPDGFSIVGSDRNTAAFEVTVAPCFAANGSVPPTLFGATRHAGYATTYS